MKKIIATVLAMVMALALCTTAFAANTSTSKTITASSSTSLKLKEYKLQTIDGVAVDMSNADSLTYNSEAVVVETKNDDTTKTVTPAYYTVTDKDGNDVYGVVVDASIATHKVIKGGAVVDYVYASKGVTFDDALLASLSTSKVVTKTLTAAEDGKAECNEYYFDDSEGDEVLYMIDGKVYVAVTDYGTGINYALLNGKLVAYDEEATLQKHSFDGTKVNTDKGTITSAYCVYCKHYIDVVKTVPYTSVDEYAVAPGLQGYFYKVGTTAVTDTTDSSAATSPKTFDAGIAMYVGMALTSVAGSAVVIGKKKEF